MAPHSANSSSSCTRNITPSEDYQGGIPRWCSGCGDNAILPRYTSVRDEDLAPERTVCSCPGSGARAGSRTTMKTYGFHGIHGRAFPLAEGVRWRPRSQRVREHRRRRLLLDRRGALDHAIRYNMNLTVILHDNQIYGLTKKPASRPRRSAPEQHDAQGSVLEHLTRCWSPLGVQNASFVRRASNWGCRRCCTTSSPSIQSTRLLVVRIIQRCPEWLPKTFEPWLQDPGKTSLLTHKNGLQPSADTSASTRPARTRPLKHPPGARVASTVDPIPVGILYHDPSVPLLRGSARRRRAADRRRDPARLDKEFDKFTIWPDEERAQRAA